MIITTGWRKMGCSLKKLNPRNSCLDKGLLTGSCLIAELVGIEAFQTPLSNQSEEDQNDHHTIC